MNESAEFLYGALAASFLNMFENLMVYRDRQVIHDEVTVTRFILVVPPEILQKVGCLRSQTESITVVAKLGMANRQIVHQTGVHKLVRRR